MASGVQCFGMWANNLKKFSFKKKCSSFTKIWSKWLKMVKITNYQGGNSEIRSFKKYFVQFSPRIVLGLIHTAEKHRLS